MQPNEKGRLTIRHWKDKDLYYNKGFIFQVSKRVFFFFFEVSFSWCCVWREKETTCTESARCCFLITGFFPKRLLSSPDKAVSPLDPRIGMSLILLLLGISKSFHTSKLAPEKLYETFSPAVVQSTGMRRAPSCPGLRVSSTCDLQDEDAREGCCSCLKFVSMCRTYGLYLKNIQMLYINRRPNWNELFCNANSYGKTPKAATSSSR